jgi:pimeloyl-ACP methyl ester carboxylesterase
VAIGGLRSIEVAVDGVRSPVLVGGPLPTEAGVVFVHGNPGSGLDWEPLMGSVSSFAYCVAPTMPGYGDADKPADFDYTAEGYGRHLGGLLNDLGIRRVHLVLHDLGGPWGLAWAAAWPAMVASLTFINIGVVPGYRWHRFARLLRTPVVGEMLLLTTTRPAVMQALRRGSRGSLPVAFVDRAIQGYRDSGTRRAILRFYRATPDLGEVTQRAAASLREADPPTLVIWGAGDPYVPVRYAQEQQRFFPRAEIVVLPLSGHWPFLDDPAGVEAALIRFLRTQIG